jgi:hypothetical protein
MLDLASHIPCTATHAVPLPAYFVSWAACVLSKAVGLLGFVCAPYGFTYSFSIYVFSEPNCMFAEQGCMRAWLGFVHALGAPSTAPLSVFSQPSCMCAERRCMHPWLGIAYAPYGYIYSSSSCIV